MQVSDYPEMLAEIQCVEHPLYTGRTDDQHQFSAAIAQPVCSIEKRVDASDVAECRCRHVNDYRRGFGCGPGEGTPEQCHVRDVDKVRGGNHRHAVPLPSLAVLASVYGDVVRDHLQLAWRLGSEY